MLANGQIQDSTSQRHIFSYKLRNSSKHFRALVKHIFRKGS